MKISQKIEQLFNFRKLPFLLEILEPEDAPSLYDSLFKVQEMIYDLDLYLENNWALDELKLEEFHKRIYHQLASLGYTNQECRSLCHDILVYERHEKQLRKNILPTSMDLSYYYHFKSCDVRLIRQLIVNASKNHRISNEDYESFRLFDYVTELHDDFSDLEEDMHTINGNAFLIALNEYGTSACKETFESIMDKLHDEICKIQIKSSSEIQSLMNMHSLEILEDSRKLFSDQLENWDNKLKHIKTKLYMFIKVI